jgi:hypothetical protein
VARLAVDRRRVDGDERWALFDGGDLGMLTGGHGHAGCLGLNLYAGGRPLVVDRGTSVYNVAPAWRHYFRNTRAHSTVLIDGVEQAEPERPFRWATRYRSELVRHVATGEYTLITGQHDAYARLVRPVIHRRTLVSVAGQYWICVDRFTGTGMHSAEFLFHLAPELEVEHADGHVRATPRRGGSSFLVAPAGFADAETRVVMGGIDPIQGWHSDDYGERRPAPTVVTTEALRLPAVRAHVLAPCVHVHEVRPVVQCQRLEAGLALTVQTGDTVDVFLCAASPGVLAAHGLSFEGELLLARLGPGAELTRALAVQARRIAWRDEPLVQTTEPPDWIVLDVERVLEGA